MFSYRLNPFKSQKEIDNWSIIYYDCLSKNLSKSELQTKNQSFCCLYGLCYQWYEPLCLSFLIYTFILQFMPFLFGLAVFIIINQIYFKIRVTNFFIQHISFFSNRRFFLTHHHTAYLFMRSKFPLDEFFRNQDYFITWDKRITLDMRKNPIEDFHYKTIVKFVFTLNRFYGLAQYNFMEVLFYTLYCFLFFIFLMNSFFPTNPFGPFYLDLQFYLVLWFFGGWVFMVYYNSKKMDYIDLIRDFINIFSDETQCVIRINDSTNPIQFLFFTPSCFFEGNFEPIDRKIDEGTWVFDENEMLVINEERRQIPQEVIDYFEEKKKGIMVMVEKQIPFRLHFH